jgi:DNA-binding NtrC family response regulator
MRSVLIIDPDLSVATALAQGLESDGRRLPLAAPVLVTVQTAFNKARAELRARPPSLLITNLELREYNGLHLVYLAQAVGLETRTVVYTGNHDAGQAREVRGAGAFYDILPRVRAALPAYVAATLPPVDRRVSPRFERRIIPRGGRRVADLHPTM